MSNDPVDGGTVTYHRAEWIGEKIKPVYPWMVQFVEDGPIHELTRAEGEAMGLTPPEPAPLVVTCNGHSIELSDEEARGFAHTWRDYPATLPLGKLGRLLRDARQDPQPASDDGENPEAFAVVLDELIAVEPDEPFSREDVARSIVDMLSVAGLLIGSRPAPLSPGECLRGLLAGRDDADRLLRGAAESWYEGVAGPRPIWWSTLRGVIGDAAREVHG